MHWQKNNQKDKKKNYPDISVKDLDKAGEIAWYYGFKEIKSPHITKEDVSHARQFKDAVPHEDEKKIEPTIDPAEKIALLRMYTEGNMQSFPQPIMVCYKKPLLGEGHRKHSHGENFGLEILGSSRSIVEAVLLQTALAILEESGFTETYVEVNSLGDRESTAKFERDLASYYRKHVNTMPASCRQEFKRDVFEILKTTDEKCKEIRDGAPQALSFLSDQSRDYFKEVLESLEVLGIPYKINSALAGTHEFSPQLFFAIREGTLQKKEGGTILAIGGRFNFLAKRIGMKKEIPSVGISLLHKNILKAEKKSSGRKIPRPKFYFIQLGPEAKLKSLTVIDMLRKARVPVYHSLTKDKIAGQMSTAENMRLPYMIIMGQKEAHENTVVVRNIETRSQDTVSVDDLVKYLKKLK